MKIRQIRAHLAAEDLPTVQLGLDALLNTNDPAIFDKFTNKILIEKSGRFRETPVIRKTSEIGKRVQPEWQLFVALAVLRRAGQLDDLVNVVFPCDIHITTVDALAGLKHVESLTLFGCYAMSDLSAVSTLSTIQRLNCSTCKSLSDLSPLAGLPALERAWFPNCTSLTDLSPLREVPALWHLDLAKCTALTHLNGLAGHQKLRELDLSGCTALEDISALRQLPNLYLVNLTGCSKLPASHQRDWCGPDQIKQLLALS